MSNKQLQGYIESQMQQLVYIKDVDVERQLRAIWTALHQIVLASIQTDGEGAGK